MTTLIDKKLDIRYNDKLDCFNLSIHDSFGSRPITYEEAEEIINFKLSLENIEKQDFVKWVWDNYSKQHPTLQIPKIGDLLTCDKSQSHQYINYQAESNQFLRTSTAIDLIGSLVISQDAYYYVKFVKVNNEIKDGKIDFTIVPHLKILHKGSLINFNYNIHRNFLIFNTPIN